MLARLLLALLPIVLFGCGDAEREPARNPQAGTVQVTAALPAATLVEPCPAREQRPLPAVGSIPRLGVFEREPAAADALPDATETDRYSWLPASTLVPGEARRVGSGRFAAEIRLFPSLGVWTDARCDADESSADGPGICLVAGTGRDARVRCFTSEAIRSGRALALTGSEIHGIVPDDVEEVHVTWRGRTAVATLADNVFEARLPGIATGATVKLSFVAPGQPRPCAPSPALLAAVPALNTEPPAAAPPDQLALVVDVHTRLAERWARVWGTGDGLTYWVVPQLRCGVVTENDRACMAVEARFVEGAVCASAADIAARGASDWYPIGERPVIAGFAPTGATTARVRVRGYALRTFPVRSGAFAGALAEGVRMDRPNAYLLSFVR